MRGITCVLVLCCINAAYCLSPGWNDLFHLPEAREFNIALQENIDDLLDREAITMFIPEDPEHQKLGADLLKKLIVKGAHPSSRLAWAHMRTLDYTETPILWGKPNKSYSSLSTIKVAGEHYVVFGENAERHHIKITKPDVINTPNLVVHFTATPATYGSWGEWGPPTECSKCGDTGGTTSRTRACYPAGFVCEGSDTIKDPCVGLPCRTGPVTRLSVDSLGTCSTSNRRVLVWEPVRGEYLPLCQAAYATAESQAICIGQGCGTGIIGTLLVDASGDSSTEFISGMTCTSNDPETCTAGPVVLGCPGGSTRHVACYPP